MKTKNIFKALALVMLLPAMLLTTACSKDDVAANNIENTVNKGYPLQVTVNVTRQGDEATTRTTYNETTKKLSFSTGDQLFVNGNDNTAGSFAGALTWVSGDTFSGTITTKEEWKGTADALFTQAYGVHATLLPNGYENYDYFYIYANSGYNADVIPDSPNKAFALTKKIAVEQFSNEHASAYSSGFALSPQNAILNFTIIGLQTSIPVDVALTGPGSLNITGSVTTDGSGNATFAMAVGGGTYNINQLTLTVGENAITLSSTSTKLAAGHIYNITRSVYPQVYSYAFEAQDGDYDMNDIVLKVTYPVLKRNQEGQPNEIDYTKMKITMGAAGSTFKIKAFIGDTPLFDGQEVHDAFGVNQGVRVNTGNEAQTATPVEDVIDIPAGIIDGHGKADFSQLDVWIHVNDDLEEDPSNQIIKYLPDGVKPTPPNVIMIPEDWRWPLEGISIEVAYPGAETEVEGVYNTQYSFKVWLETSETERTDAMNEWFKHPVIDKTMTNE